MGMMRSASRVSNLSRASRAKRVEALSADTAPLHRLPPMVATLRTWGPPMETAASPSTGTCFRTSGSWKIVAKGAMAPMERVPSPSSWIVCSSRMFRRLSSPAPARLPCCIRMSTSVPPAMTFSSGLPLKISLASWSVSGSCSSQMSNMLHAPLRQQPHCPELLEHHLGIQGDLVEGHPRGIQDGVAHGRRGRDHRAFAQGLGAEGPSRVEGLHEGRVDLRRIQDRGQLV